MWRSPTKRQQEQAKRDVERLFTTNLMALYRLVRLNLCRGREPLSLHRAKVLDSDGKPRDGFVLSAVTTERVQRDSFVGVVDDRTTVDDLAAMTEEE